MRRYLYSSISLVKCARRMQTRTQSEPASIKLEEPYPRRAISLKQILNADLLINKKLSNNESIEDSQWGKVRQELLQKCEDVNDINVNSQVYDICARFGRIDQSINYYQFLEKNKYPINLATMTTYLKLLYYKRNQTEVLLSQEEEKSILRAYNRIKKEYDLLDPKSASYCLLGLSVTIMWEECFKLLEMIKVAHNPASKEYSAIISAALRNNKVDMAFKMLNEILVTHLLHQIVYTEYLNYCKRNFPQDKLISEVEKMFLIWQKYDITPHEQTIEKYEEVFRPLGYTTKHTSITPKGICHHCRATLKPTIISKEDFKILSSAILKNLIIGKDVYFNTSPHELKKYMIFLKTMKPYDVIIDGLNVAYASHSHGGRNKGSIDSIRRVVQYFQNRNKRTLVVGRMHMKWWKTKTNDTLEDITDVFYTKNLSQDDPFLLHITLSSGSETNFVSRDFMRQHKNKIEDPTLKQLFKNWQMSHQYMFYTTQDKMKKIQLCKPLQYHPCAQKSDDGWHIPYTTLSQMALPQLYEPPENWLCIKSERRKKC